MQGMEDLAGCHKEQQSTMMSDIKTEMSAFQKKILGETVSYYKEKIYSHYPQLFQSIHLATPRPIQCEKIPANYASSSLEAETHTNLTHHDSIAINTT